MKPDSSHLLKLLRERHAEDVFVPECKNGPTQSVSNFARVDAWAMKKSWTRPCVWGYEIKVSRTDFVGDSKWMSYLPMCNELYFVAPKGLIRPDELSADVGLLEVNGSRLVTKKKSGYRDIQIPENVWRYILMCRTNIKGEDKGDSDSVAYWRSWLEQKAEERELGYRVSRAIRDHVDRVYEENRHLRQQMESYEQHKQFLRELGYDENNLTGVIHRYSFERRLEAATQLLPDNLLSSLVGIKKEIEQTLHNFDFYKKNLAEKQQQENNNRENIKKIT